jgi:hypothetical protein
MRRHVSVRDQPSRGGFTEVELTWIEGKIERWIRFGLMAEEQVLDRRTRIVCFAPRSVFAFVRWASNDYGTLVSRIDIIRAVERGAPCQTVPYVKPGGEILLRIHGWPKVERVLQLTDWVESLGLNPAHVSPSYWRQVHNRLVVGEEPRRYCHAQHQAWLMRASLGE